MSGTREEREKLERQGWRVYRDWRVEEFVQGPVNGLGLALLIAAAVVFFWLHGYLLGHSPRFDWIQILLVLPTVLLTTALHEGFHGVGLLLFGIRPAFGIKWFGAAPVPYATGNRAAGRWSFITFALMPLVAITLIGLRLMAEGTVPTQAYVALVVNTSGAAGDLWMAAGVLTAPGRVSVLENDEATTVMVRE